jgi:capsular polysaccharide biosynthesis protein
LPKAVELRGDWTSIVSRFVPAGKHIDHSPNYTHWLLEALPRLALLPEFPATTQIIVPPRLHKNQAEALRLMGIFERCRPTTEEHLRVENYYFSPQTTMLQGYSPYGVDFLRRTFLPKRDTSYNGPKKFYIQRLGLTREPLNRVEIERFFAEHGWQPIDIMQLSFAQQIQLFAEAESITGMFGSAFTNSVFCS